MSKVWFVATGDRTAGPYSAAELKAMAAAGDLQPGTLIQKEGTGRWVEARSVGGLLPAPGAGEFVPVATESPPPDQPAEGEDRAGTGVPPAADGKGPGAGTIILWVLGGIVAVGVAIAAAVYYGLFLLVRWWWTKEPRAVETPGEMRGSRGVSDQDSDGATRPEPAPATPARRGILGRLLGTLGWLGSQAAEGVAAAGQQGENNNLGGYFGPAQFAPCGVCGAQVARGAVKCPHCHENPSCGPKIY